MATLDLTEMPSSFKAISPFLLRARELQKHDPTMSYYCGFHACQLAMGIRKDEPEERPFLMKTMNYLEALKEEIGENLPKDEEASAYVEGFAHKIFCRADDEDRAGNATMRTAKTFLAAMTFFDVLNQFGELREDVAEMQRYAKFKAADITKCLKAGTKPTAGPPNQKEDQDLMGIDSAVPIQPYAPPATYDPFSAPPASVPPPTVPTAAPYNPSPATTTPMETEPPLPPKRTQSVSVDPKSLVSVQAAAGGPPPQDSVHDALKYAKYAVSALQFEDVPAAMDNLRRSLNILENCHF